MIGYHWSPADRHDSIRKHGLLVPTKHPKLVVPVTCSEGHRNPHISLGKTPSLAWALSAAMPWTPGGLWHLWEVWFQGQIPYRSTGTELQVRVDIPRRYFGLVAERTVNV
ncbi:hypothetical protein HWB99_gp005 [Mycobacterium phage DrLupo]|uniref:Uncharacterized protein n=1 Tax=Mycobacterium phage DrLupo TaxID=2499037 RepID=A0A3S9UQG6_9CAUD|nr:hypothetical protein HWB99_gp005 [Mycobacterium phage DrLupo]AZS12541.1 hypothetical protein SEA_DRLUPO_5 [Mycobacterium phage DrLupo]